MCKAELADCRSQLTAVQTEAGQQKATGTSDEARHASERARLEHEHALAMAEAQKLHDAELASLRAEIQQLQTRCETAEAKAGIIAESSKAARREQMTTFNEMTLLAAVRLS